MRLLPQMFLADFNTEENGCKSEPTNERNVPKGM